jgi:protein involved in polysaccharide export with SLBB domain
MFMRSNCFGLVILSLFLSVSAYAQVPVGTIAQAAGANVRREDSAPKAYAFGPGDEIAGRVTEDEGYNFTATVDENGLIQVSFVEDPIVAQCKTLKQLKEELSVHLKKYLKNPTWSLVATKQIRRPVTVFGEVVDATKIDLTRRATLLEVLAQAKGPSKDSGRVVQVYRPTGVPCSAPDDPLNWKPESGDPNEVPSRTYNLSAMGQGSEADNPVILPGDIVYVAQATPVYITGEVRQPGAVLLKREGGTTLFDAISMVSGVNPEAKSKDVKIYRKKPGSVEREVISVNLDKIKKREQLDVFLEPYDMVVVDKAKKPLALLIAEFAIGSAKQVISSAATSGGQRVIY